MATRNRTGSGTGQLGQIDENMIDMILTRLAPKITDKIENQLEKLNKHFEKMECKINNVVEKLCYIEKMSEANKEEIKSLNSRIEALEQKVKSKTLRMVGIEEEANENLLSKVCNLFNNVLKVTCTQQDISNLYRTKKIENQTKPRAVLVTFTSNIKRNEVYAAKKHLKGTNMFINEDLTTKQYKLLGMAKKKYGNKNVWSLNGRIFARIGTNVKLVEREIATSEGED
ncbi:unnamed protein product [Phaedon cochleariae]|uniref:Uncharacterized protein n=1 Tax=Phaedon cochleariae TaxID=80249 RepID=A0A9P0DUS1_PHACE|nr:unnamed protein product [Phaedon cochleariae]